MPVYVIDTLKPKNGLDFAVVEAINVAVEGYTSLADAVTHFATQSAIDAITAALSTKADTSTLETATLNLQNQIDQIVISASAESVVAPEVAAARVGADGTSYQTLKSRLDAENDLLKDNLSYISSILGTDNLKYIQTGSGYIVQDGSTGEATGVNYTAGGTGNNQMMLINDAELLSNSQSINANLGYGGFKYGMICIGEPVGGHDTVLASGEFETESATSQTVSMQVPDGTIAIYIYNRATVLSTTTITIQLKSGAFVEVDERLSQAETEINLLDIKAEDIGKIVFSGEYSFGYYLNSTGARTSRNTSLTTDYIPVMPGQRFTIKGYAGNVAALYCFFTAEKVPLTSTIYVPSEYGYVETDVTVPNGIGAAFMIASSFVADAYSCTSDFDYSDILKIQGDASYAIENVDKVASQCKYGSHLKKGFDFSGKTSVWFGDSITAGVTSPSLVVTERSYATIFAEKVGAKEIYNRAVSGSCICDTDEDSILSRVLNYSGSAKDFTVIAGGTNDYSTGKPLGDYDDTTPNTFYGALRTMCEHLSSDESFSDSRVIFISPINQNANRTNPNAVADLHNYRNAIYEIAASYGFDVVDGEAIGFPSESGGFADAMCTDGVHPTQLGHEYYADGLCGILL